MSSELPSHARVVIIGGGVGGASIAYHLTLMGWKDVVVLERGELTCGSTWHSAGLVGQLRSDFNLTRMITVILMVVAGGLGHVWGGVIGAALITLIAEWTRSYYQYEFIIFGLIVVLTMMYMPRGIGGYIDRRLATRRFVAQRRGKTAANVT